MRDLQVVLASRDVLVAQFDGRLKGCVNLWDLLQNAGIDGRRSAAEATSVPSLVAYMLLGRHNFF
jgi:hypothetical protein